MYTHRSPAGRAPTSDDERDQSKIMKDGDDEGSDGVMDGWMDGWMDGEKQSSGWMGQRGRESRKEEMKG